MFDIIDGKCGCGEPVRYLHWKDGVQVGSCNKYKVCSTYDEMQRQLTKEQNLVTIMQLALEQIVGVNAMDYEYKAWAKRALDMSIAERNKCEVNNYDVNVK